MLIFSNALGFRYLRVSLENTPQSPFPQPSKPYWTAAKIVGVILVVVLVVSVSGFAALNYLKQNPSSPTSNNSCSNGATNYPSCNSNTCTNGATNPPSCTSNSSCSNGATNPPSCDQIPGCSNGATNYPQCTTFRTTTSLTCTPSTIMSSFLITSDCTVTVTSTAAAPASGDVGLTANYAWYFGTILTPPPCVLSPLSGGYSASCSITNVRVQDNQGSLIITGAYSGDNSHLRSTGQFTLGVSSPPQQSTVSGVALHYCSFCLTPTTTSVVFVSQSTSQTYTANASNGDYSITLPNLQVYSVTINYSDLLGSHSCNGLLGIYGQGGSSPFSLFSSSVMDHADFWC
jgi:hypothetical protein